MNVFFQRHIAVILALWGAGLAIIFVIWKWVSIEKSPTISSFVAGAALLIITAGLIPIYRDYFLNKPNAYLIDSTTGNPTLNWHQGSVGSYELSISIKNEARLPLINRVFYQILIPIPSNMDGNALILTNHEENGYEPVKETILINGEKFLRIRGRTNGPVYSKSFLNLLEINLGMNQNDYINQSAYYYLSTEFGFLPQSAYKFNETYFSEKIWNLKHLKEIPVTRL